jgi:hypothetical protein
MARDLPIAPGSSISRREAYSKHVAAAAGYSASPKSGFLQAAIDPEA